MAGDTHDISPGRTARVLPSPTDLPRDLKNQNCKIPRVEGLLAGVKLGGSLFRCQRRQHSGKKLLNSISRTTSVGFKPRPRFVRFSGKRGHKSDVGQVEKGGQLPR